MVTVNKTADFAQSNGTIKHQIEGYCLSTDTKPIEKRLSMHFMLNLWLYRFYSIVPTILFMSPSESTIMVWVLLGAT